MIQPRLTELNTNQILLFLGYRGQELDEKMAAQIDRCEKDISNVMTPLLTYRFFPCEKGKIALFPTESSDLQDMLKDSDQAVFMAATLGPAVERLLMRTEISDMADALIMDACASAAIENICDNFEQDLRDSLEQKQLYLTDRFSPGYGDLPIATQKNICSLLDVEKRIGLTLTRTNIMVPRKSVTAILGISSQPQILRKKGCEVCNLFRTCAYRKDGITCHD